MLKKFKGSILIGFPMLELIKYWFYKKHKIKIDVVHANCNGGWKFVIWTKRKDDWMWDRYNNLTTYFTYNKALKAAIKETIVKNIKDGNNKSKKI